MKNIKNLAIDSKFCELEEAEKYSKMIQFVFGNKTFFLQDLKRYMESDSNLDALKAHFDLPGAPKNLKYSETSLRIAADRLKVINDVYQFLTVSRIDALLSKAQELNAKNDRVLNNSSLFRDWEVKLRDLPLSARIKNALKYKDIFTINDLSDYGFSEKNMLAIRNIGPLSLDELRRVIEPYGLIIV